MMKYLVFSLLVVISTSVSAQNWNGCKLSEGQQSLLHFSYSYGKPLNVGWTLAAIAMSESRLGNWNINIQDPSGSPWHVTLDKYLDYRGWEHTDFNYNRAAHDLMNDYYAGALIASREVEYWYNHHDDVSGHERWRRTWASYNTGHNWDSGAGERYARKILDNIRTIRECEWIRED